MGKLKKIGEVYLPKYLAACKDWKERHNIRSALRELKGLKHDGNSVITYSFHPNTVSQKTDRQTKADSKVTVNIKSKAGIKSGIKSKPDSKTRVNLNSKTEVKSPKNDKQQSTEHRKHVYADVLEQNVDRNYTLNKYLEANGGITEGSSFDKSIDENANVKPDGNSHSKTCFRSFLSVGCLRSPRESPGISKEGTFRAKKVNITRVKVLDKTDLHDKSTGTEESAFNTSKTDEENDERILKSELKTAVNVITPSKWKSVEQLSRVSCKRSESTGSSGSGLSNNKNNNINSKLVSNIINQFESRELCAISDKRETCNKSLIKERNKVLVARKGSFNKCDKISARPVNVHRASSSPCGDSVNRNVRISPRSKVINSPCGDSLNVRISPRSKVINSPCGDSSNVRISPRSKVINSPCGDSSNVRISPRSKVINSPRKPRKIVSYRTSAFSNTCKLNRVSSTVSRATLHSAPPAPVKDWSEQPTPSQEAPTPVNNWSEQPQLFREAPTPVNDWSERPKFSQEPNTEDVQVQVDSNMKEFANVTAKRMDVIVMSPVEKDITQTFNEEIRLDTNTDNTNEVFKNVNDSNNNTPRKKSGLSRKNRVESDEQKFLKKYRKKSSVTEEKVENVELGSVPKLETVIDTKNAINEQSAKKMGTVRRKLPKIPVKRDISEGEDDESVHDRTLRLLRERKRERQEKLSIEKEAEKDKNKMSPADLKKTLEQKLERSDSKKKAFRVRRELQLLNRENELKSGNVSRSSSENEHTSLKERDNSETAEDLEIANLTKVSIKPKRELFAHKSQVTNHIQRSKSDVIKPRRAVSETEVMFDSHHGLHNGVEERNSKMAELLNSGEPATPVEKINLIGNLMQEEAKLQDMLRKSTNFSEKRRMRADVRQLRQRRNALEGTGSEHSHPVTLRRCVSVATTTSHVPTDLGFQGNNEEHINQPSIDDLRKQLSETQDYDEKKKIRLALRQLRQHSRDDIVGQPGGLQRSQSFIHRKNSAPVIINTNHNECNGFHVGRSQSVTDQHHKGNDHNDAVHITPTDNAKHSRRDAGQQSKTLTQKHHHQQPTSTSADERGGQKPEDKISQRRLEQPETTNSHKLPNGCIEELAVKCSTKTFDLSPAPKDKDRTFSDVKAKSTSKSFSDVKARHKEKTSVVVQDHSRTEPRKDQHEKGSQPRITASSDKKYNSQDKHVDSNKDNCSKVERRNSILEKLEIFENANKTVNNESSLKSPGSVDSDKTSRSRGRSSQILVSRAHIERSKQDRLVSVRRVRSLSEEPRKQFERERDRKAWDSVRNDKNSRVVDSTKDAGKESVRDSFIEKKLDKGSAKNVPGVSLIEHRSSGIKHDKCENQTEPLKNKDSHEPKSAKRTSDFLLDAKDSSDKENRLSPSLLWLEEKRKSLTTPSDIEKLMSTMEIEAAFSEILDAVKFPEDKGTVETVTADVPIVEEGSESSGVDEDVHNNNKHVQNGDNDNTDVSNRLTSVQKIDNGPKIVPNIENGRIETTNMMKDECIVENDNLLNQFENNGMENGENELDSTDSTDLELNNKNRAINIQTSGKTPAEETKHESNNNLHLDIASTADVNGAISVIHGDDGTVTVQEVNRMQEGDATITEWKKIRRTQSKTETRETDTVVERKITSPGGNSSVYEKDVSKTKQKLTSRGSIYYNRNHLNIKKKRDNEGTEIVEHELNSLSENMSVSKNESWGDKTEAKVTLNRELSDVVVPVTGIQPLVEMDNQNLDTTLTDRQTSTGEDLVKFHLGKPSGCPEITHALKETFILEGNSVKLECTAVSSPAPTVVWYKGDNQITDGEDGVHIFYDTESGKATLQIASATEMDTGEYKCTFDNPLGTASTNAIMRVKKKCIEVPTFVTMMGDQTVREGQALCLDCDVTNADSVTWLKDGVVVHNNADFKQTFDGTRAKLEMMEAFIDDDGTYTCVLKNSAGENKCTCVIIVKESECQDEVVPMFLKKLDTQIVDERDTVILECEVIGSPQPNITWFIDRSKVNEGQRHRMSYDGRVAMLVVRKVTLDENGKIECVAENCAGRVTSDCLVVVKAKKVAPCFTEPQSDLSTQKVTPFFTEPLSDTIITTGENAVLECAVQGDPVPQITWRKNGAVIGQIFDFKQTVINGVAKLEINKCCTQDCGLYECVASYEHGEISTSCRLTVQAAAPKEESSSTKEESSSTKEELSSTKEELSSTKEESSSTKEELSSTKEELSSTEEEVSPTKAELSPNEKVQPMKEESTPTTKELSSTKVELTPTKVESSPTKVESSPTKEESSPTKEELSPVITPTEPKVELEPEPNRKKTETVSVKNEVKPLQTFEQSNEALVTISVENGKCENEPKLVVCEEKVQTSSVTSFPDKFVPKHDEGAKTMARSQASKVMLVRKGSLRAKKHETQEQPLRRSGSLQSVNLPKVDNESKVKNDTKDENKDEKMNNESDGNLLHSNHEDVKIGNSLAGVTNNVCNKKSEEFTVPKVEKSVSGKELSDSESVTSLNQKKDVNSNISKPTDLEAETFDISVPVVKKLGAPVNIPEMESTNDEKPKAVSKFRSGEIRRTQSTRAPASEKPEWLQVKLRKVGSKQTPSFITDRSKATTQSNSVLEKSIPTSEKSIPTSEKSILTSEKSIPTSEKSIPTSEKSISNAATILSDNTPSTSVHREIKLSRSQSARVTPGALKDSTNSPLNRGKEPVKLTSVSERARMFQTIESNTPSGKQSPSEIIAKAINLSRAESMRSPMGSRPVNVHRSSSLRTETQSTDKGNVTLNLTPQQSKGAPEEKSDQGSTRHKLVKYWDPTAPSQTKMDYSRCTNEEELNNMLSSSDNFDERKKIRARIKELRDEHMKAFEAKRQSREKEQDDVIKRRHREADLEKQRKLQAFNKQAAEHHEAKHLDMAEQHLKERMRKADEQKKRQLDEYSGRQAVHLESKALEVSEQALKEKIKQADILKKKTLDSYDQAAGKNISQTSTVKTDVSRDGKTTTTTRRVETVTKVGGAQKPADEVAPELAQKIINAVPSGVSGVLTVKTESWNSKDGTTRASEKTETWGGRGGAMNAFKQMDAQNNPGAKTKPGGGAMMRSPSAIKTMLLEWCKAMTREYIDTIEITNFSTSWNDGMAFCALIHHFYPESFNFKALNPKQRRKNFELAFDTAEKYADIAPLLDVEDMVRMQKPDWKCVFTYVQSFYRKLRDHDNNKTAA